jgi:ectoine hydroxylase-related dioxygenase (phytanoyl-CoA dioxygenase family)
LFLEDGLVHVPDALDADTLAATLACWEWSMAHPGPAAARLYTDELVRAADTASARALPRQESGFFYQDIGNPAAAEQYADLVRRPAITELLSRVLASDHAWFLGEQIFLKEGATAATGWHQDISDLPAYGDDLVVLWIPLDPVDADTSLALVPGSHHGPVYSSIYGTYRADDIPQPEEFVTFACEPGDIVVFHMGCLHGGGPTRPGQTRRALALRFTGDDAFYVSRSNADDERNGRPFRHDRMLQVLP